MSMKDAFKNAGYKGGGGHHDNRQRQVSESIDLPNLTFRDEQGYRKKELFTVHAQKYADEMARLRMTQTQLRKYYNEVKALEARIEANPDFMANEALIGLLKSKVAYGLAKETDREKRKGFEVLLKMVEQGIAWSTKKDYFKDFVLFFESVIGFFRGKER